MNTHFTLDRESFQNLLARASLAQEYLDSQKATPPTVDLPPTSAIGDQQKEVIPVDYIQSLSAIVRVQRSIATDDVDVDGAMALIADQARNVANADGVTIGLLEGDNLVYRAGSGAAATYIGRYVKAALCNSRANGEILRVENAQTDMRIEAAICRQFGARALLIVPICRGRAVVGAMEILFGDAHAFQDREVRTYQLMAGLVAEAISHAAQFEPEQTLAAEVGKEQAHSVAPGAEAQGGELSVFRWSAGIAAMITRGAKGLLLHQLLPQRRWKPAAAVVVLVMAGWIAYSHRGPVSPVSTSALPESNAIEQQVPIAPAKLAANSTSRPQTAPVATPAKKKAARTTSQQLRVWRDVDYIAEDVTVRYVTLKPAVVPQKRPMGSPVQPETRRIQPPKVVHAPEKPEIKQISVQHKTCEQEHLGVGRHLVCWLRKVFPTHKLPSDSPKEWQTPDFSYVAEDPVR
ncbi:MAG TPA: GAF domain-containing protein [Terriglobales bacterium]|nr:GAF domain-containing protein [Terriglobales bacterium]